MSAHDVGVILAAAGTGSRFGRPKQFDLLGGIPIYQHSIRAFAEVSRIGSIVVVTHSDFIADIEHGLQTIPWNIPYRVISGGETRQESVSNGLEVLRSEEAISIVLVHDVARPLVGRSTIEAVIAAIRESDSALAAIPVVDTLKRVSGNEVSETVSRHNLWRAQTPQGATKSLLIRAFEEANRTGYSGTDECELLERMGERPRIVLGDERNFKITYHEDLERAKNLLMGFMAS